MIVVVPAAPPRPELVFPELAASELFTPTEAARLYAAALRDTLATADAAGGDLLVNYLPTDAIDDAGVSTDGDVTVTDPSDTATDDEGANSPDPEAAIRTITTGAVSDVRFEPQVGSSVSARIGNTVTHLLREENADSVAIVRPRAPLVRRSVIDGGAMKLRSNGVVLGPTTGGGVAVAGFAASIDFAGAFGPSELEVVTDRARDVDREVEFLRHLPRVDTRAGLRSAVSTIRARVVAERVVPPEVAALVAEFGLRVRDGALVRD